MELLSFILGIICGVFASAFVLLLFCVMKSRSKVSRAEERWNE